MIHEARTLSCDSSIESDSASSDSLNGVRSKVRKMTSDLYMHYLQLCLFLNACWNLEGAGLEHGLCDEPD